MSVVIETTLGDITVDLFTNDRPRACLNFLKLCKLKYYNYNLFHTISRGFIAQTGDPSGSRSGGESIYGVLDGLQKKFFEGENEPRIKHTKMGLISFVGNEDRMIGSQFFLTLGEDLTYLDEKHCVFGEVVEGFDILEIINEVICDNDDRPYQDVRITHTVTLDDPFPDPKRLNVPSRSPSPNAERLKGGRIAPDEEIDELDGKTAEEIAETQAEREAKARATILEMVGDLPDADMAPPENVLFVCKLNPVTNDDDLEIIFSRFGKIKSCEVIRDKKTGDSLQYAFVEFEDKNACENAYFKMDNVLIDDRRIHVDFSQSVSKVKWRGKGRGVTHYDEKGKTSKQIDGDIGKGNYKHRRNDGFYKNDEKISSRQITVRSSSPNHNGKFKQSAKPGREESITSKRSNADYNRDYSNKSRSGENRTNRRQVKSPLSSERRRYSKSPISNNDKHRTSERERYISKTNRDRSVSPKRNKDDSLPSRRYRDVENDGSLKYRKMPIAPSRKKDSSPSYRRSRHYKVNTQRRSRSVSPRRDDNMRNHYYEDTGASSSRKTYSARKRSLSKDRQLADSDFSHYDDIHKRGKTEKDKKRVVSGPIKSSLEKRRSKYSPDRNRTKSRGSNSDSETEPKKRKPKKKKAKYSSSESTDSDCDKKLKKKKEAEGESSDSDYINHKSKKKKSLKKSKHNSSSDSDNYKKKTKKKYEND